MYEIVVCYRLVLYHGLVFCFAFKNSNARIPMRDDDAPTDHLRQTFCNNVGNEAWFDNLKLQ